MKSKVSRRWVRLRRGHRDGRKRRGRPSHEPNSHISITIDAFLNSVVSIAWKHDLDAKLLIEAFVEAWSNGTSHCRSLKITRRDMKKDSSTFLITDGEDVVSQFPIMLEILKNSECLKDQIQHVSLSHCVRKKRKERKIV